MLRNWLIEKLGGRTREEFGAFKVAVDKRLEDKENDLTAQRAWFYTVLESKDEEIKRLTNLMLQEHGIIRQPSASNETKEMKPLNKRVPWKERQEQLQRDDAKKQADAVKAAWDKKNEGLGERAARPQ